jgi:hypothetical protein
VHYVLAWFRSAALFAALLPYAAHATVTVSIQSADAGKAWVASVPIGSQGAPGVWEVPPGTSAFRAPIERGTQTLLCIGASQLATSCRRISVGQDSAETFALEPGREARGSCFLGRQPAAKAELRLTFAGLPSRRPYAIPLAIQEHKLVESVKTDSEGRFVLAHIAPGDYVIDIRLPNGRVHRTATIAIPARKPNEEEAAVKLADISIPPGVDVAVRVRTLAGLPVAKAAVGIWQERGANDAQPIQIGTTSDGRGNAVLSGADMKLPMHLNCWAEGFVRANTRFEAPPREATCTLERFASIRGEVRDDKGTVLPGATVSIGGSSLRATTDAHGTFLFPNMVAADYDLRAALPGFRAGHAAVSVATEESKEIRPIELTPGDAIKGRVRDAESALPVPNALVKIIEPPGGGEVTSDDTGAFSLTADATTAMAVEASASGYATVQRVRPALSSADDELVIDLPRPGQLEVVVWDEDDNAPCGGCTVHARLQSVMTSAITDASGVAAFENTAPGEYQVTRDFARASSSVVHVSGGGQWRSAVVKPGETTRVRIGEPATNITITLSPAPPLSWRLRAACPPLITFAGADTAGVYVVRKRDGACTLSIVDQGRSTYVGTIPEQFHDTTLAVAIGSGIVTGSVVNERGPIAGANVQLTSATGQFAASAITLANGSFEMDLVGPGTYVISSPGISETRTISVTGGRADVGTISSGQPPLR